VGILWLVRIVESLLSFDLGVLGIHPRSLAGTVGIITGPLVHGDFQHLMSNSLPLIFLGIGVFYFYNRIAIEVFLGIYFFTSFWVWMVARMLIILEPVVLFMGWLHSCYLVDFLGRTASP
jgi:membrane associated rhomboid family serine protease